MTEVFTQSYHRSMRGLNGIMGSLAILTRA